MIFSDVAETSIDVSMPKSPLPSVIGVSLATLESSRQASLEADSNQLKRGKTSTIDKTSHSFQTKGILMSKLTEKTRPYQVSSGKKVFLGSR